MATQLKLKKILESGHVRAIVIALDTLKAGNGIIEFNKNHGVAMGAVCTLHLSRTLLLGGGGIAMFVGRWFSTCAATRLPTLGIRGGAGNFGTANAGWPD